MTTNLKISLFAALVFSNSASAQSPTPPAPRSPSSDSLPPLIVGTFTWTPKEQIVTIKRDGTATSNYNVSATWRTIDEAKRRYELRWSNGFVDDLVVSADGTTITGSNQNGPQPELFKRQSVADEPTDSPKPQPGAKPQPAVVPTYPSLAAHQNPWLKKPSVTSGTPAAKPPQIDWDARDRMAQKARSDEAIANSRRLDAEWRARNAEAVARGTQRGLERATDILTPPRNLPQR